MLFFLHFLLYIDENYQKISIFLKFLQNNFLNTTKFGKKVFKISNAYHNHFEMHRIQKVWWQVNKIGCLNSLMQMLQTSFIGVSGFIIGSPFVVFDFLIWIKSSLGPLFCLFIANISGHYSACKYTKKKRIKIVSDCYLEIPAKNLT